MRRVKAALVIIFYFGGWEGGETREIVGPEFRSEPPAWLEYTNSSGATLNCRASGSPAPRISWIDSFDSPVTHLPPLREVLENGSLYFSPFEESELREDVHATSYRCVASNPAGRVVSRECKLRPEIISDYEVYAEGVSSSDGNVGLVRCGWRRVRGRGVAGGEGRLEVRSWLRQEPSGLRTPIIPQAKYLVLRSSGELHLRSLTQADAQASFLCEAFHPVTGQKWTSEPGKIPLAGGEGRSAPRILQSSDSVQAKAGSPLDLACVAQGTPPPIYRWYKERDGSLEEIQSGSMAVQTLDSVLRFSRLGTEDAGKYVCVAGNNMGEDKKFMELTIFSPLSVNLRPPYQVVDGGTSVRLNCSVEGGSGPLNIAWLKDGKSIIDDPDVRQLENGNVLEISNMKKEDGGMYQCLARSGEETEQSAAHLALGSLKPGLVSVFSEETEEPGRAVSLGCRASGLPPPRVSWLLDGSDLVSRAGYMLGSFLDPSGDVVSYLNISSARVHHGGMYTCVAKNAYGEVRHSAALNIYGPPTARPSLNLTAVHRSDLSLHCPVAGFPRLLTTWLHHGSRISGKHSILPDGSLILRNLEVQVDEGEYSCEVRSQQGIAASSRIFLRIMKPPEIQEFHFPTNLQEGNRAHVSCTVISGDLPMEISWLKEGKPVPREPPVQVQYHQFVSALLFSNLVAAHSGSYTCLARNAAAQANFTSKLVVKVAPQWIVEPKDTTILYRQPASIPCQASGYPPPKIIWKFSRASNPDVKSVLSKTDLIYPADNGTIIIKSAEQEHTGHYTCQVDNGIGQPLSKTILLKVTVPAHFRTQSSSYGGVAGEGIRLVCEAEGDSPLLVGWTDGPRGSAAFPVPRTRFTSTGVVSELELEELSRDDSGTYTCTARNDFGDDTMVIHLTITEVPEAPKSVEVYEIGNRWVNVRWETPHSSATPLTSYLIQFREEEGPRTWSNVTVAGESRSSRLGTLLPHTAYQLRVLALNKVGLGPPSPVLTFTTLQEAPNSAPDEVRVEATEPQTLSVKWKALKNEMDTKGILGYQIFYYELAYNIKNVKTLRGQNHRSVKLNNLKHYTKYEIFVRAFNRVGLGPPSTSVISTTMEGGVTGETKIKKTTNLELSIHGLSPHSNYSLTIMSYTSIGDGIESPSIYCYTDEDVPGPPESIKALVVTSDSVLISWSPPLDPNGSITKYYVYIHNSNSDIHKEIIYRNTTLMYEWRRLKEFQHYDFWVTASTSVGEGPKSMKVNQVPESRAPARIASFSRALVVGEGERVDMDCYAVGLPAPITTWRDSEGRVFPDSTANARVMADNRLVIDPVSRESAGNYTCRVENVFGEDKILYGLLVVGAPRPPDVAVLHTGRDSIDLHWKAKPEDIHYITGFLLRYKGSNGDWKELQLDPDRQSYKLQGLSCGRYYFISLQSMNMVGKSQGGSLIKAATKGGIPLVPEVDDILLVNSTSAMIFLDSWPTSGCPVQYFSLSYRSEGEPYWKLYGDKVEGTSSVVLRELEPGSRYQMRLTAVSPAGSVRAEFSFATLTLTGEMVPWESTAGMSNGFLPDMNLIVPAVVGAVCIIIIIFGVSLIKGRLCPKFDNSSKTLMELENLKNNSQQDHAYSPSPAQKGTSSLSVHKGSDTSGPDYEICPYATFSLSAPNSVHQMVKFKTFNQHGSGERLGKKDYHCSHVGSKIGTSKSPPDGLSLEISCISSQQTLEVEKKKWPGSGGTPAGAGGTGPLTQGFVSDSESSGDQTHHPPPRALFNQHTESTVFELDSSTESADMSPEVGWRPMVRRGVSSR